MSIKLRLRYLIMVSTLLFITFIIYLIINKGDNKLIDKPISTLGNIENNYLFFVIGSIIALFLITYFLYQLYKINKIKFYWWIYLIPLFGLLMIFIPYNDNNLIAKQFHTFFAVIAAFLILCSMYFFIIKNNENSILIKKISKLLIFITFIGTFTLFLFTGINTIMQLFYFIFILIWFNLVSNEY
jgi:hypothetical protein